MGNSKETICGELLYEFMVHEKGFKISGRWNNHEQKKLLNDFAVMRQLIQLIELEIYVSFGEIKEIVLYLKNADVYVGNVLQRKDSDMMKFCGKANVKTDSKMLELIEKGERIINSFTFRLTRKLIRFSFLIKATYHFGIYSVLKILRVNFKKPQLSLEHL